MTRYAKIITALIAALTVTLCFFGCQAKEAPDYFSQNSDAYAKLKDFALEYFKDNADALDSEYLTLSFSREGAVTCDQSDTVLSDVSEEITQAASLVRQKFEYLHVYSDYVVFWEDETKYYGLLWSETPRRAAIRMEEDYYDFDKIKINSEWYVIGSLYG